MRLVQQGPRLILSLIHTLRLCSRNRMGQTHWQWWPWEREDRCEAAGLPAWERPMALGLSMMMASVALWPRLTGLLPWVDCQQAKSSKLAPVSVMV